MSHHTHLHLRLLPAPPLGSCVRPSPLVPCVTPAAFKQQSAIHDAHHAIVHANTSPPQHGITTAGPCHKATTPPRHHATHTDTNSVERQRDREFGAETLTEERGMPTTPERVSSMDWMQLPPSVSVNPYPWMMGQIAAEQNSCTCL